MLCSIQRPDSKKTLKLLLHWLLGSFRPLRLEELAEVVAIDTTDEPHVRINRRLKRSQEIFDLCSHLVTLETDSSLSNEEIADRMFTLDEAAPSDETSSVFIHDKSVLRLAHSSIIEYLTGDEIANGPASEYKITQSQVHALLAEASLAYIVNFDSVDLKLKSKEAQKAFPLVDYALEFWFDHAKNRSNDSDDANFERLVAKALRTRREVYRHVAYLSKVPEYDTWPSSDHKAMEERTNQSILCDTCSKITFQMLTDPSGSLHLSYDEVRGRLEICGLCRLLHAALVHFAAMRSLQKTRQSTITDLDFENRLALQDREMASRIGQRHIHIVAEKSTPFVLIHASCYFGRLHMFTNPGKEKS